MRRERGSGLQLVRERSRVVQVGGCPVLGGCEPMLVGAAVLAAGVHEVGCLLVTVRRGPVLPGRAPMRSSCSQLGGSERLPGPVAVLTGAGPRRHQLREPSLELLRTIGGTPRCLARSALPPLSHLPSFMPPNVP